MLTIRLQRVGKKNQAAFRIVLAEKQRAVKKLAVEILGFYNPRTKEFGIKNPERLNYWIGQHATLSPTVNNLLIDKGLLKGEKVKSWRPKAKAATAAEVPAKVEAAKAAETPAEAGAQEPAPEAKSEEAKPEEKKEEPKPGTPAPATTSPTPSS